MALAVRGDEIRQRLGRTGRTQSSLARHLGRDVHYVGRLLRRGELTPSVAQEVESFFAADAPAEPGMVRVPVFGYAAANDGEGHVSLASDQVLDEIDIPAGAVRGEAMAVRVAGDSMEPRLFSGELVIVARKVPPARYGDCVVELRDGTALVKQYRGQRDGRVFLYQFNPEREVSVPGAEVKALHAVVWRR